MHEVRNPLDALTNLLHLAGAETDVATLHQYIRDAEDRILSLHQIAGQSLTLARVTQGENKWICFRSWKPRSKCITAT